ncbi:GNAT family N-acetyltransferase [Actinokineospora xionganensis]|uniref:GNAT family N-acetyltransferase n=1 Tax=Actinokineospora xionganensis TaxID=2684470 RepID=A0ABR7L0R3_9PSEU|nr:GNAT family protein [Actinokineospora xionganensis]MBC6446278.1 GNAT family N-acetyltransferase [Actinokineospora xionganensis]
MRKVVAAVGRVVLADQLESDQAAILAASDGAFDVDPDDRPKAPPVGLSRVSVLDAETGELLGVLSWHETGWGRTRACGAWNLGVMLLPAARGRGLGAVAVRLLIRHLFATTDLDRVEAATDVDNVAACRALERAGFLREGVVRGAQLRGGVRRDMILYGVLRSDLKEH